MHWTLVLADRPIRDRLSSIRPGRSNFRANGAKSRGPITAERQTRRRCQRRPLHWTWHTARQSGSAQNAIRHGLLADSLVFPGESEERFCDLLAVREQELQPAPGIETDQVHLVAVAHWRRMRFWSVEKSEYLQETAKRLAAGHREEADTGETPITHLTRSFRALSDETRALELLNRYENRYSREYRNVLACFKNHREDKERARKRERAERTRRLG